MFRPTTTLAAVMAVLAILFYGATQAQDNSDEYARGIELYRELGCGVCHAFTAAGTTGLFAPGHDAMGVIAEARFRDPSYQGEATDAAGYIRESIVAPRAYLVPGYAATYHKMPGYSFLSEEDLEALVALLLAAGRGDGGSPM